MNTKNHIVIILFVCLVFTSCTEDPSNNDGVLNEYKEGLARLEEENNKLLELISIMEESHIDCDIDRTNVEPNQFDRSRYLYDYNKLSEYRGSNMENLNIDEIVKYLQPKGLVIYKAEMNDFDLKITYELDLRYENQRYYFYYNKEMQDSIMLLTLFDDLRSIEFNYVVPGYYGSSALPYTRETITSEIGLDLSVYDVTDEFIRNELHLF